MGDDIRYTRSPDGLHIAWEVRGDGPLDVMMLGGHGVLFPFDAAQEQPRWRRFGERLQRFARVVDFDLRGVGYSDRFTIPPTVSDWAADALAVLDAAEVERAVVIASNVAGLAAIELAAEHPERVRSLVLANSGARFAWAEDYPIGAKPELLERLQSGLDPTVADKGQSDIEVLAPSLSGDDDARGWWTRTARRGATPAAAQAVWKTALEADVRALVPSVVTPTMVLVTTGNQFIPPRHSQWLASHLPNVDYREIDAPDQVIWAIPDDAAIDEIEQFLTGRLSSGSGLRSMQAVLFTDIVASTAHNAAKGDRAWLEVLDRHDRRAAHEVQRHGGRVVKHLGDGLLAVFPLVSDAVAAARDLTGGAGELGLDVRAGLHVAEVEQSGDDVLGLGVTIAARVLEHAQGGELLTTAATAGVLAGAPVEFEPRGRHRLKGVSGEWDLVAIRRTS